MTGTAFLLVGLGGALGAVLRYGASLLVVRYWSAALPLATWSVNLLGCLLIGLSVPLLLRPVAHETGRLLFVVGFLGSFTTFSTYSLETIALWQDGMRGLAALNVAGSAVLGVLCVWLGLKLGEALAA